MPDCPTDFALLRFSDGQSCPEEVVFVIQHLQKCGECRDHLEALAVTRLRAAHGSLPPLDAKERNAAMERITGHSAKPAPTCKATTESDRPLDKSILGLGIGAAITELGQLFSPPHLPALAADAGSNVSDDVRNHHGGASISSDHNSNTAPTERESTVPDQLSSPIQPDKVFGNPPAVTPAAVQQSYEDTCAIRSQEIVLRDFGVLVSEDQLRQEAFAHGWYAPGEGTSAQGVGELLNLHGVPTTKFENANIFNLQNELAQGHRVIVAVDSGELWHRGLGERFLDAIGLERADHALVVSSIDTTDPEHVKVVLTDPGSGEVAAVYSQEQFQDAWKDSSCFMVATKDPAPPWNTGMANFDYAQGHLDYIGEMPYAHMDAYMAFQEAAQADPQVVHQINEIYNEAIHDYKGLIERLHLPLPHESLANDHETLARIQHAMFHEAINEPHLIDPIPSPEPRIASSELDWPPSHESPLPDPEHTPDMGHIPDADHAPGTDHNSDHIS